MRLLPLLLPPPMRQRVFSRQTLLFALVALLGASLLMLVNVPRALACPVCISPDKVTVSGAGIAGTAAITDLSLMGSLSTATFMGFEPLSPVAVPVHTGSGYELVRYYRNSGVPASFWTLGFDHMRYYPGAAGQPGYIFYEGPVSAEASTYAQGLNFWQNNGKWFQLTTTQDNSVRQLLTSAHANPQSGAFSSQPPASSVPSNGTQPPAILRALTSISLPVIILLACGVLLVAGAGYRLLRARRLRTQPFPAGDAAD